MTARGTPGGAGSTRGPRSGERAGKQAGERAGKQAGERAGTGSPMGNGTGTPALGGTGYTARPLPLSFGLSVVSGVFAVLMVANGTLQVQAIGLAAIGLTGLAIGLEIRHRGFPAGAALLGLGGLAAVIAAIGMGLVLPRSVSARLEVVPGLLGLLVLVVGLSSVKPGYERWFVSVGTGAILLAVYVSGFLNDASTIQLLLATVLTVVAWDVGEQSINMGEHLGRRARTLPVELAHAGAGAFVGLVGVAIALVIGGANVSGLPLLGLAALLGAGVVLALALHT